MTQTPTFRTALAVSCACALFAACASQEERSDGRPSWQAVRDSIGDTLVVRTVAGSVWGVDARLVEDVSIGVLEGPDEYMLGSVQSIAVGADGEIYVMDRQVPALRVYESDGTYRQTIGREGEGPGEYRRPDGGMAVLSDGRIVLRDPSNARFNVYSPRGESLDTWIIRGNFNTSRKLYRDTADNVWTLVLVDPEASVFDWVMGLAQYRPDGAPGDTLVQPTWDYEPPTISGQSENNTSVNRVPFSPSEHWSMSPLGYLVAGLPTEYAFTLYRTEEPPLRIERHTDPVPVAPSEGARAREQAERNMRNQFPGWRWNGPDVPDRKPAYQGLHPGEDGRIWVWLSGRGYEVDDPNHDPDDPDSYPTRWREDVAFDVFEPDGSYLGRVEAPPEFSSWPEPIFGREYVWAVTRDDFDVQRVVRFRIERGAARVADSP